YQIFIQLFYPPPPSQIAVFQKEKFCFSFSQTRFTLPNPPSKTAFQHKKINFFPKRTFFYFFLYLIIYMYHPFLYFLRFLIATQSPLSALLLPLFSFFYAALCGKKFALRRLVFALCEKSLKKTYFFALKK
ncbi:MAG: hypothetical protein J6M30_03415, partial [Bacteroidales bacterium]|nr:hypothetical protein [Bacteroidales bacterium]